MNKENMAKVIKAFRKRDNFLVTSHVNPEGDSIGSQIAVYRILKAWDKKVIMVNNDTVPENLRFLKDRRSVMRDIPDGFSPETIVILDCSVKERTGNVCGQIKEQQTVINIDHHVSNEFFGDINWVEAETSSVGEMIFNLAREAGIAVDKDMAEAIYTAIITDTGMFNYTNTSKSTHEVAGELIAAGIDPKVLHEKIFEDKPLHQVRLLGKVLTTLKLEKNGKLAHMCLTEKMYADEGVDSVPTDEFINFPRSIKGVEVAVFFKREHRQGGQNKRELPIFREN
ncbi:bifunctional oligoribonuclease/PAP phosphatase NrnA [Candidatus Omnitrophota bacterium]